MEKTDNEIIAEFMGFPAWETYIEFGGMRDEKKRLRKMEYHTSWDWLMPVVEKIGKIDENWLIANDQPETPVRVMMETTIFESIIVVHYRVVSFIKWYNTQPKQNGN